MVRASARSTAFAKRQGWTCWTTERWVPIPGMPGGGRRMDMGGWCDHVVIRNGECVGVQSASMSGRAAHLSKMGSEPAASGIRAWLSVPGHRAELWSWRRIKVKRGGKAVRWECEVTPLGVS